MIPLTFSGYTTHMWYLYMLVGLYLFMPFFSSWIEKNDRTLMHIYLILWGASLLLPYLSQIISPDLFGVCAWNPFGTFHYFAGFTGYLLLGYLLGRGNPLPSRKIVAMGVMLYFAGYVVTYTGFSAIIAQYSYEQAPDLIEMFWQFCSPNVALMTLGMFLIVQRVKVTSSKIQQMLAATTKYSFGTYLMHYIFIGPAVIILSLLGLSTPLCVVCSVVMVFVVCQALTALIYKLAPRAARYIVG